MTYGMHWFCFAKCVKCFVHGGGKALESMACGNMLIGQEGIIISEIPQVPRDHNSHLCDLYQATQFIYCTIILTRADIAYLLVQSPTLHTFKATRVDRENMKGK